MRKGFGGMPDSVHSPASDGTTRRSSSRRAATVVGRMYLEGILTEAEAAAGFLYAENVVRTRLSKADDEGYVFSTDICKLLRSLWPPILGIYS